MLLRSPYGRGRPVVVRSYNQPLASAQSYSLNEEQASTLSARDSRDHNVPVQQILEEKQQQLQEEEERVEEQVELLPGGGSRGRTGGGGGGGGEEEEGADPDAFSTEDNHAR